MSAPAPHLPVGTDPSLYLVTDTRQCTDAGRTVAATVAEAVAGGAGIIQIRDKHASDAEFHELTLEVLAAIAEVREAESITRPIPVFVNDRVAVARLLRAAGHEVHVHVGQSDEPPAEVRAALGPDALIGLSAATPQEFAAARESGAVDLLGVGPVYDTSTKADAPAGIGPARLRTLVAEAGLPCVAIGGITAERTRELTGTGVIGVCVVSAICAAPDPRVAAQEIRVAFAQGRAAGDTGAGTPARSAVPGRPADSGQEA